MQISFDPNDKKEVAQVASLLESLGLVTASKTESAPVQANISASPENRVDPENSDDTVELDANGMPWNAELHASTKNKNSDGTWKVARGKADENKAAIQAHKAAQNAAPAEEPAAQESAPVEEEPAAPATMPTAGMPSMPAPTADIPAPVVTYEQVVQRFTALMEAGKIADYQVIYNAAGIANPADLQTNESLRSALWVEMDKVENA